MAEAAALDEHDMSKLTDTSAELLIAILKGKCYFEKERTKKEACALAQVNHQYLK